MTNKYDEQTQEAIGLAIKDAFGLGAIDGKTTYLDASSNELCFLNVIPGLGESAAQKLQDAREEGEFLSIEDLKQRTGISKAVVEILDDCGVLDGLSETNQIRLF